MAKGNIFVLVDYKHRTTLLVTLSAQLAAKYLQPGCRVEVWRNNVLVRKIFPSDKHQLFTYMQEDVEILNSKKGDPNETV